MAIKTLGILGLGSQTTAFYLKELNLLMKIKADIVPAHFFYSTPILMQLIRFYQMFQMI